jgi:hypothetical protein
VCVLCFGRLADGYKAVVATRQQSGGIHREAQAVNRLGAPHIHPQLSRTLEMAATGSDTAALGWWWYIGCMVAWLHGCMAA